VAAAADALSGSRLLIAAALPGVLSAVGARGSWLPLGLVAVAALTDFLDGVAARRSAGGPSRHGAVLDNVADLGLVVGCTGAGAVLGLVPAAVPIAAAHLGPSQMAWVYFFGDLAPAAGLMAYSLAAHLIFMLMNALIGLCFLRRAAAELGAGRATGMA